VCYEPPHRTERVRYNAPRRDRRASRCRDRYACIGSLASFLLLKEENHENHAPKKHTRINRVSVRNSPRGTPY